MLPFTYHNPPTGRRRSAGRSQPVLLPGLDLLLTTGTGPIPTQCTRPMTVEPMAVPKLMLMPMSTQRKMARR